MECWRYYDLEATLGFTIAFRYIHLSVVTEAKMYVTVAY